MAVTAASLTSGSNATPGTSFATASITPTVNRLVLFALECAWLVEQALPPAVTVTFNGTGLTFVLIPASGAEHTNGSAGNEYSALYLYRAMGSSITAGTCTVTSPVGMDSAAWSVVEFAGVDMSGTNGSGAVVQIAENTLGNNATGLTVTLAAFSSAGNATYGAFGSGHSSGVPRTHTPGTGFTELHDTGAQFSAIGTQWRADNDTTVDTTLSDVVNGISGFAIEIKEDVLNSQISM